MGSNDIIKPLSTVLSRAVIESLQHLIILRLSENFRERGESNQGPLGEMRERYPLCFAPPPPPSKRLVGIPPLMSQQRLPFAEESLAMCLRE